VEVAVVNFGMDKIRASDLSGEMVNSDTDSTKVTSG